MVQTSKNALKVQVQEAGTTAANMTRDAAFSTAAVNTIAKTAFNNQATGYVGAKASIDSLAYARAANLAAIPASVTYEAAGGLADYVAGGVGASGEVKTTVQFGSAMGVGAMIGGWAGPGGAVAGAGTGAVAAGVAKGFASTISAVSGLLCFDEVDDATYTRLQAQKGYSADEVIVLFFEERVVQGWQHNYGMFTTTSTACQYRADAEDKAKRAMHEFTDLLEEFCSLREEKGWSNNYGWGVTTEDAAAKRAQAENDAKKCLGIKHAKTRYAK
eukprot:TRINITY_DN35760_c0_g1_i1.p1 TRINITY_DN35760_c0_g1~~TRINITY_DN35760_c0_g1_i1.p1  ORF type:complete len:273 (-),score=24.80 TRINITY_DN35760_c0_g1_i1:349-1167(-)